MLRVHCMQVQRELQVSGSDDVDAPDFDGNQITPGTAFMERASRAMQRFLQHKLATDKEWQKLLVRSEPGLLV